MLNVAPTNSQIVLGYLMKAEWATSATIAKKTLVRGSALGGTLGQLVRSKKILRVPGQSGQETIYVYLSKKAKARMQQGRHQPGEINHRTETIKA